MPEAAGNITLRIRFGGLCLFVKSTDRWTVLFPDTSGHEPHFLWTYACVGRKLRRTEYSGSAALGNVSSAPPVIPKVFDMAQYPRGSCPKNFHKVNLAG